VRDFSLQCEQLFDRMKLAKAHKDQTNNSILNCCRLYQLHRTTFTNFLRNGTATIGRPVLLLKHEKRLLKLFLLGLETISNTQMPISEVVEWIRKCSSLYQSNPNDVIVTTKAARYIFKRNLFF
jgi:hypothetical protein